MFKYDETFFKVLGDDALRSGGVVVPLLQRYLRIESVLDVGCGQGGWLKVWQTRGVDDIFGIDGPYVHPDSLFIPKERFLSANLSQSVNLSRQFDLVQSLEVAEHIDLSRSEEFLNTITNHGRIVMFSAAVPGQGGTHHVNEQPFEFWRDRFATRGYRQFDCVRPRIRGNRDVEPWYRYGTFLYVQESFVGSLPNEVRETEIAAAEPVPVVAPIMYQLRCKFLSTVSPGMITRIAAIKKRVLLTKRRVFGGH